MLGYGKDLKFENLRKTNISTLFLYNGDRAHFFSDQGGMGILHSSNIDKDIVLEARRKEFKKMAKIFMMKKN